MQVNKFCMLPPWWGKANTTVWAPYRNILMSGVSSPVLSVLMATCVVPFQSPSHTSPKFPWPSFLVNLSVARSISHSSLEKTEITAYSYRLMQPSVLCLDSILSRFLARGYTISLALLTQLYYTTPSSITGIPKWLDNNNFVEVIYMFMAWSFIEKL